MSLSTNLLGIPQKEFGLAGIHTGDVISQELDKQDKGFKAQYNPDTKRITVLNTSDLPPAILTKILYEPSASREYDEWHGYYPVVREGRDQDGNLEIEFSAIKPGTHPGMDRSGSSRVVLISGRPFHSMPMPSMDFMPSSMRPRTTSRLPDFSFMSSAPEFLLDTPSLRPSFATLRSVDLEEPVSQEEEARMSKAISDGVLTAMGQFFNRHGLADGGIWYPNDYRKYLRDEIDSEMDQSFFTGYAKDEFFEKTGRFTFKLREGKKASEALMSFLNGYSGPQKLDQWCR